MEKIRIMSEMERKTRTDFLIELRREIKKFNQEVQKRKIQILREK